MQLAQLTVHEQEPEPEPELVPEPEPTEMPVSATGVQGLTAVAQYDYEVRVLTRMALCWTMRLLQSAVANIV